MIRLFQSPKIDSWIVSTIPDTTNLVLTPYNEEWYLFDNLYVHKSDITLSDIPKKKKEVKSYDKQTDGIHYKWSIAA